MPSNTEADEGRYEYAMHGERLPYDVGRYGSGDVTTRREAEVDERELR